MKRSTINQLIEEAITLMQSAGFRLPPFAYWTPEDWAAKGSDTAEIRSNGLGWDVTDFGSGDFPTTGLLLFTLRNGSYHHPDLYPKRYAEKIMIVKEGQVTPYHYHWKKREDIINRGGGYLALELHRSTRDSQLSRTPFTVAVDGIRRSCGPGETVILRPGESICLEPYLYHKFYGEPGRGTVIVGEVSDVNDDANDNCFLEPAGRFPAITEDEPPRHLLCTEYPS